MVAKYKWLAVVVTVVGLGVGGAAVARSGGGKHTTPKVDGAKFYDRLCLPCHGTKGDGGGPAAPLLWPRPRDFTTGNYKWRTTGIGQPPSDADLAASIRYGAPGTSMHSFVHLSSAEIDALVAIVKSFAPGRFAAAPTPIVIPASPKVDASLVDRGEKAFKTFGCTQCHGESLAGDGPGAKNLRDAAGNPAGPYNLTKQPLRRPRPHAGTPRDDGLRAIYTSITTGIAGTAMAPALAVPEADRWAIAAFIDARRYRPSASTNVYNTDMHPVTIDLDRKHKLTKAGYWPGKGAPDEARIFGKTIPMQGPPPASLAPAQASLDATRCARCHAKQHREWTGSLHGKASSPGTMAQLIHLTPKSGAFAESCQRCHSPLAEQLALVRPGHTGGDDKVTRYTANKAFDPQLRKQGITCAGCHVRGWQRFGPRRTAGSTLLPATGYPVTALNIYERSDFCLGCHQLPVRLSVAGKPLLNTYREWLEGPYMPRGIQCQHCHMPNREHTWKGVHDPDTFRQGIKLSAGAKWWPAKGVVSARAVLTNVGAGHYLPTTPTPAAWIEIELVDETGTPIRGARATKRIGRKIAFRGGKWHELEDTRVAPGKSVELSGAWKNGRVAKATHARITVRVAPDDYYTLFYKSRLRGKLTRQQRALFNQALRDTEASVYVAETRLVPVR